MLRVCLCISFLVLQMPASGNTPIDYNNPDILLLERLTLEEVNNVRKKHSCEALSFNEILYLAAKNHALYVQSHKVGHFQPENPVLETPQLRVDYYGGKNLYAGENVLMTTIRANYDVFGQKASTYQQLAQALAAGWVSSPGHFQNMITPNYSITAVAISYDYEKQALHAVQVFAFTQEDIYSQAAYASIPKKYPHNLKLMPKEKRKEIAATFQNFKSLSLMQIDGQLVMVVMDRKEARDLQKMIRKKSDGLVIEKVLYDAYRCGNKAYEEQPSRHNGNYFLNGDLLQPVYRNQLYRQVAEVYASRYRKSTEKKVRKLKKTFYRQQKKVPYWLVKLGETTDEHAAYNLMLIQKKKLVAVNEFHYVPGKILSAGPLPPMRPYWLPGHFSFSPGTTKITLEIPFALNQWSIPTYEVDKRLMIDSLKKLKIIKIDIEAFASVEGDFTINRELHQKRAGFIKSHLQKKLPDTMISYSLKTGENWQEFARQIRRSPYSYLLKRDKSEVKNFLRSSTDDTIKTLLQKQRRAIATVSFLDTSGKYDTLQIVSKEWDSLINLTYQKIPQRHIKLLKRKLEVLQKFLYNSYLQSSKGAIETIVNQPFPRKPVFAQLINNRNWFLSKIDNTQYQIDPEDIAYCAEYFEESDIGKYNFLIYHLSNQNVKRRVLEKLDYHFDRIDWSYIEKEEKRKIAFNLYRLLTLLYSSDIEDYEEMGEAFQRTVDNFPLRNQKDSIAAAYMYANFGVEQKAYFLIQPIIEKGRYDKKTLSFFLKLAILLPPEMHYQLLKFYQPGLGKKAWCNLFNGLSPISFQVFNHAPIRNLYCKTCE